MQKRFCSFEKVKKEANVQNRMSRARSQANFHTRYGRTKTTVKTEMSWLFSRVVLKLFSCYHLDNTHTHTPNAPNHLCLDSRVCCTPCVPLLCVKRASAGSYGTAPAHVHTRTHTQSTDLASYTQVSECVSSTGALDSKPRTSRDSKFQFEISKIQWCFQYWL